MLPDRVRRQIERLLSEAEAAIAGLDWPRARRRARAVLALDPDNRDATAYLKAAERALGSAGGAHPGRQGRPVPSFPGVPFLERHATGALATVLAFALAARLLGLWYPATEYYDEVYHAFTAQEMLRGNPAAWEWSSQAPPGYAYEWTHPPLAKLLMVVGLWLPGEQESFGWRLPAALLGTGVVYLVYLLGRSLLHSESGGLAGAAVFALDGLPLAMSRVGMNDVYLLFASLAALYFFLKDRYLLSSVFLGLALASKWSAVWVVPVLLALLVLFRRRLRAGMLWFLPVPPLVYLAAYSPFFLTGHTAAQFIELHQQMWWYQTNLAATHVYQSPWWSWPLLLRPLWMFTAARDALVSNIYAMGNPVVFWSGLAALAAAAVAGVTQRQRALLVVPIAWAAFFLPWALSPRILFIQHYLPALPFLALASGWLLVTLWNGRWRWIVLVYLLAAIAAFLFFYPHWTGIFVPRWWDDLYYWLPSWR